MALMQEEYDIIFAGGGTCAGIAAARLATADPMLRILVLESGPHTKDDLAHIQVARFLSHLHPESKTINNVVGRPSEDLDGRRLAVQCGHCVGGASSINFAMYTRAAASDYDDWEKVHSNPGWSFEQLLPFIKKAETYQIAPDKPTHGYDGPLKVSYGRAPTNVGQDYLATVGRYDKSRTVGGDANTMLNDVNRHELWPKWIDRDTGRRSDVAHCYVYKALTTATNLHLRVGCFVRRVLIENGRAAGVEYVDESQAPPHDASIARATKLIVLSAGAFGSPAILERSGIGATNVLECNGVKQIVSLPGVGENYNDHPLVFLPFHAKEDSQTLDGIARGDPLEIEKWGKEWLKDGTGLMATNGVDGGMKFRPYPDELLAMGEDVSRRWQSFHANAPDKAVFYTGMMSQYAGARPPPPTEKFYTLGGWLMYPRGIGSVHITSADDVHSPPDFDTGVFKCIEDLAVMRYYYKRAREIGRRMASFRGEYTPDHPNFPPGSSAALLGPPGMAQPVAMDAPDIVYTQEDDEAIDKMLKASIITAWHSLGTCAMKPRENNGVVDPRLNVYGIQGLKVADMSICPSNVGANTYSTAILIGEKAASVIGEDLRIEGV